MKFCKHKYLAAILLALVSGIVCRGQYSVNMVVNETIVINACEHPSGTIYDDGGPGCDATFPSSSTVIIKAAPGDTITASFTYNLSYNGLSVYSTPTISYDMLARYAYYGVGSAISTTGYMLIQLNMGYSVASGFSCSYHINDSSANCHNMVTDLAVSNITDNSARLAWEGANTGATYAIVVNGTLAATTSDRSYTLTGLTPESDYQVTVYDISDAAIPCCGSRLDFYTQCTNYLNHNFTYDDLGAANVLCQYGSFPIPRSSTGCVDAGSSSIYSRHTVHHNTSETDPWTGGLLHTVPDGYCTSVRLGNWQTGSQAESITYTIDVDTTIYDLLILKYAAVLQDPRHTPSNQPKFTFEITDTNGNQINECYNATFISGNDTDWNTAIGEVLWKDWTTVGADLATLHGQRIHVRFTTYDCAAGAHFGYAYFVLGLGVKNLSSQSCSGTENTFYAPDGFSCRWYRDDQPNVTLSTADSLHVTQGGLYRCRLDFIGAPNGVTGCHFILTAYAGDRYPVAQFSTEVVDTVSSCAERWLRLRNESHVTSDPGHDTVISNRCESYLWLFDDGTTSTEMSPLHSFSHGSHTVTLYAMLANGLCTDSVTQTIFAGSLCHEYDTITEFICDNDSLVFYDTVLRTSGVYSRISMNEDSSLMTTHTVILTVNPTIRDIIRDTIVENQLPWSFRGEDYYADFDTTIIIPAQRPECDSVVSYGLKVWPNMLDSTFYFICESEMPYTAHGVTFYGDSNATVVLSGIHGEDSTIIVHFHVLPASDTAIYDTITDAQLPWFFFDTVFNDSVADHLFHTFNEAGCDSTIHYNLYIFWNGDRCDTTLFYPNVVTPNGDGINDKFVIGGLIENNCFKYSELSIYSREGHQVYHIQNIHDESQWWDPAADRIPAGTYFYFFKAHGIHIWTQHKGVIEVLR